MRVCRTLKISIKSFPSSLSLLSLYKRRLHKSTSHSSTATSSHYSKNNLPSDSPDLLFDYFIDGHKIHVNPNAVEPLHLRRNADVVGFSLPHGVKQSFENYIQKYPLSDQVENSSNIYDPSSPPDSPRKQQTHLGTIPPEHPDVFFHNLKKKLDSLHTHSSPLTVYRNHLLTCETDSALAQLFKSEIYQQLSDFRRDFPLSHALRDTMLIARLNFLNPMLALSFFQAVKKHSPNAYVRGCSAPVYNQAILSVWQGCKDPNFVLHLLGEMRENVVMRDSETREAINIVYKDVNEWPKQLLFSQNRILEKLKIFLLP
ncbi:mitochondrial translation factor Mtf2 [Schizosaccharomyces pombe]|uniref:Mitochondrial translation factor 2 n=1 Tax=Schizosaccharomyces pombe (strain 972 / ATCC 24843) TaxID=284812 RepID=MITF2_SCHPO|nr:putative translation protein [Schizosaccharomyces pombe]O14204.1 RecName: Full=Uncharacterized protein C5D6.12 [Schizosaccharomyces pombe 972h-]CAB10859.1 mitochondrial translation protein (predicted) [Schizosaccharomyces pombe]|eukprot:NP_593358.1 putative translation protein [Schizosaccharomyces pombe]